MLTTKQGLEQGRAEGAAGEGSGDGDAVTCSLVIPCEDDYRKQSRNSLLEKRD